MHAPSSPPPDSSAGAPSPKKLSRSKRIGFAVAGFVAAYVLIAYVLVPLGWLAFIHRHPAIDATPGITVTSDDHPGDPVNVALIGSEEDVKRAMTAAGWHAADPLGVKSDLRIAADTVLERPYETAPVSKLYLFGRVEDLAFEQPVGNDPRKRHHVRFWKSAEVDENGQPAWMGSGSFDERVGLSHTTGQITHHISPDVDAERDHIIDTLQRSGGLVSVQTIDDFHKVREGRNGGGDPWRTDGRLFSGVLTKGAAE